MVDYEFLDFNLNNEIKNLKKYFSSISDIKGKYEKFLNESEESYFGEKVEKVNKFGIGQQRYLILTNKALYNFKSGLFSNSVTLKRRIPYINLKGITFERFGERIVIHGENNEYDYYYKIPSLKKVVGYLATFYELETSKPLKMIILKTQSLKIYVTTEEEKKNNPNFSKFNEDNAIIQCLPRYFNDISMKQRELLSQKEKYEKFKYCRYDQIVTLYQKFIKKDPSLFEKVCIICLKDKDYKEIVNMDITKYIDQKIKKDEYLNELKHYINQKDLDRLKPFLIQDKCPHFYHKYCLNFKNFILRGDIEEKCTLCQYGFTTRNLYLFDCPSPENYYRIHLYLNGVSRLDGVVNSYNDMFKAFINKYICFISSDEKRKNVKESIEVRLKCLSNKEFCDNCEYWLRDIFRDPLNFEIDFNDEKNIQRYKKRYNDWERSLYKNNNDDDDEDDEDYYRNEPKYENRNNKTERLNVCQKCEKFCLFCGKKKPGSLWYNSSSIKGHSGCISDIKSCIVCRSKVGLWNANNYCEDCRRKKSGFIAFNCYICKNKL